MPLPAIENHEDDALVVPADCPQGVLLRIRRAVDAALRGNVGKLVPEDDLPVLLAGLAVPLCEDSARNSRVFHCRGRKLAVVGIYETPMSGIAALAVITGEKIAVVPAVALDVAVAKYLGDFKRVDVDFV